MAVSWPVSDRLGPWCGTSIPALKSSRIAHFPEHATKLCAFSYTDKAVLKGKAGNRA
jgi:hypothetical protein